jgi:hypothetical protein
MRIFCPATLVLPHSSRARARAWSSMRTARRISVQLRALAMPPLFTCRMCSDPRARVCRPCARSLAAKIRRARRLGPDAPVRALVVCRGQAVPKKGTVPAQGNPNSMPQNWVSSKSPVNADRPWSVPLTLRLGLWSALDRDQEHSINGPWQPTVGVTVILLQSKVGGHDDAELHVSRLEAIVQPPTR